MEHEAHDRSDIDLPGNQLKLLQDATELAKSESSGLLYCSRRALTSSWISAHATFQGINVAACIQNRELCLSINWALTHG